MIAAISLTATCVTSVRPAQILKIVPGRLRVVSATTRKIRRLISIAQYSTRLVLPREVAKWMILTSAAFITQQRVIVLEHVGLI